MSTINVTNLKGRGGSSPTLPDGAVVTGVITSTTFDGSLKTTGTPTLGLGVTINSSGINVSGVLTATSFVGSGSGLTGVGETIAPWHYNPDINDTSVTVGTGIGITFNKKVEAGSGTATLKIVNAGAAGTTIQSWGVSSCTFDVTALTIGSLVSDLIINKTYQLDIPSGFLVDSNETSYAGTAYTFTVQPAAQLLWAWGYGTYGTQGTGFGGASASRSSPVQVPGTNWGIWTDDGSQPGYNMYNVKMSGELWGWGENGHKQVADNAIASISSPVQIGSDTNWKSVTPGYGDFAAIKTDGTLWTMGYNGFGGLGDNSILSRSSPTQIPGTTWSNVFSGNKYYLATKTNGTLWSWGNNEYGVLGVNIAHDVHRSSPVQIPGTTWRTVTGSNSHVLATKTDGTLWAWGNNNTGSLGQNTLTWFSSPVQIPGTSWSSLVASTSYSGWFSRTDGTLWAVGSNSGDRRGNLAQNNNTSYSSPVQIPGTTWGTNQTHFRGAPLARKTDGTLWSWGYNSQGTAAQNNRTGYSSPVQIGSETDWIGIQNVGGTSFGVREDTTP